MARGQIPKPNHERQRRNKDAQFSAVGKNGVPPPPARGSKDWSASARDWWNAVKKSGVSRDYTHTDWQVALRCAELITDADKLRIEGDLVGRKSLLSEVRQLEDRLIQTIRARRSARISEDSPKEKPAGGSGPEGSNVIPYRERLQAKG